MFYEVNKCRTCYNASFEENLLELAETRTVVVPRKTKLSDTAGFMKTVTPVRTILMITIYLYHSTQVAEGTVIRNHGVHREKK